MCFQCDRPGTRVWTFIVLLILPRLFARYCVYFLSKVMTLMSQTLKICTAQSHRTRKMTGLARNLTACQIYPTKWCQKHIYLQLHDFNNTWFLLHTQLMRYFLNVKKQLHMSCQSLNGGVRGNSVEMRQDEIGCYVLLKSSSHTGKKFINCYIPSIYLSHVAENAISDAMSR